MNPIDKHLNESQISGLRWGYIIRFTIDLAVAVAIGVLLVKESFGGHNKIACLISIAYAQLAAFAHTGIMQSESNSGKIDILQGGESNSSREVWGAAWIAANEIHLRYFVLYGCIHIGLLVVAFWKIIA